MSWHTAQAKMRKGNDYRDTVQLPFTDPETGETETVPLTYRLPRETEYTRVFTALDVDEADIDDTQQEVLDAQERVQELQNKDTLTPAEEQELDEKMRLMQRENDSLMDVFGGEGFDLLLDLGKRCLVITDADVTEGFELGPAEQKERFNFIPETRDDMREALELELETLVDESVYPVKLVVGLTAFEDSQTLLGDTDIDEGNPTLTE